MTNSPYNVKSNADETHSANRRKFVVFFYQSLGNTNEK